MTDDEKTLRFMAKNPTEAVRMEALELRVGDPKEQTHVFTAFHSPKVMLERMHPVVCEDKDPENNPKGYVNYMLNINQIRESRESRKI